MFEIYISILLGFFFPQFSNTVSLFCDRYENWPFVAYLGPKLKVNLNWATTVPLTSLSLNTIKCVFVLANTNGCPLISLSIEIELNKVLSWNNYFIAKISAHFPQWKFVQKIWVGHFLSVGIRSWKIKNENSVLSQSSSWNHGPIAHLATASERNSVVVNLNPAQTNFLWLLLGVL